MSRWEVLKRLKLLKLKNVFKISYSHNEIYYQIHFSNERYLNLESVQFVFQSKYLLEVRNEYYVL